MKHFFDKEGAFLKNFFETLFVMLQVHVSENTVVQHNTRFLKFEYKFH